METKRIIFAGEFQDEIYWLNWPCKKVCAQRCCGKENSIGKVAKDIFSFSQEKFGKFHLHVDQAYQYVYNNVKDTFSYGF